MRTNIHLIKMLKSTELTKFSKKIDRLTEQITTTEAKIKVIFRLKQDVQQRVDQVVSMALKQLTVSETYRRSKFFVRPPPAQQRVQNLTWP